MMLDADIVAVSPSSVWRVLSQAGLFIEVGQQAVEEGHGLRAACAAKCHPASDGIALHTVMRGACPQDWGRETGISESGPSGKPSPAQGTTSHFTTTIAGPCGNHFDGWGVCTA